MKRLTKLFLLVAFFTSVPSLAQAQEETDVTSYIQNAGFDEDLTFQADGTMKEAISTDTELSTRSWAYIAADSTVYARPKESSSYSRTDGRKMEAVNGFKGRIQGWEMESNADFPSCEWTYFGSVPYALGETAVPIADDGSTYLLVPTSPTEFDGGEGFVYLRAGWSNRAVYKQTVNMPSGAYRLEYWTININPNTTATVEDLAQVSCGGEVFKEESSSGMQNQEWTKHEIDFTAADETIIQFGYKAGNAGSGGMPIVALDGIKLYGTVDVAEAYTVLSDDSLTVTFYYDNQREARGGMDISSGDSSSPYDNATTAVIDSSFANYRPTSTAYWFHDCFSLTSIQGMEYLHTEEVTDMTAMFAYCSGLTSLDVSGFNVRNVINMSSMFEGCSGLTSLNLSNWDARRVRMMTQMFNGCTSLASLDLTGFRTNNVSDMNNMFYDCSNLTTLDLSGFSTSYATDMSSMFMYCTNLTTIYADSLWNTDNVTSGNNMFRYCTHLVGGQGTVYDASHTDYTYARIDGGTETPGYFTQRLLFTETVTAFSSPSFTVTLETNGGTAQYFNNYYRLGNGGSLTLTGKSNVDNIVSVKMNLKDPARCGSDVRVSAGTLVGDTIINVYDSTLAITAQGSWPQLWLTSLEVTYEGTAPYGTYAIRLPQYLANGTVTTDYDWANEGDEVTLTATPEEGYHLSLLYANRGAVTLSPSAATSNAYTFTMPAEDVTIGAVFAEGDITTGLRLNVPEDTEASSNADTPIYNLQGQRMKRLQRGINIVGGRKQVVR